LAEGVTQVGAFTYDHRGLLQSESHPEKGGPVTYDQYDARGHAKVKVDGPSDLTYTYDKAERLTQICGHLVRRPPEELQLFDREGRNRRQPEQAVESQSLPVRHRR